MPPEEPNTLAEILHRASLQVQHGIHVFLKRKDAIAAKVGYRAFSVSKARTASVTSAPAFSGDPASKGGSGLYSTNSCICFATSSPASSAAIVSPKSIPAITPPPVMRLLSRTTRSQAGSAPNVAVFPQPGLASDMAGRGFLTPLKDGTGDTLVDG